jgi:hypothetical protein
VNRRFEYIENTSVKEDLAGAIDHNWVIVLDQKTKTAYSGRSLVEANVFLRDDVTEHVMKQELKHVVEGCLGGICTKARERWRREADNWPWRKRA